MSQERRTTAAGDATRERILDAALPLFAEHGFAGTSVRRVADAAEVNVATLAYHFGDKDGLYRAVVERLYADLSDGALRVDGRDDPVRAVVAAGLAFARARRTHVQLMHRFLLDHGRHDEQSLAAWQEPLLARAIALLRRAGIDAPEVRVRLTVFSVLHLVVRFALDDEGQLRAALRVDGDLDDALVDFLADVLRRQLLGSATAAG